MPRSAKPSQAGPVVSAAHTGSRRAPRWLALALVAGATAACTEEQSVTYGTQSLRVELMAPSVTGSPSAPLPDTARQVQLAITAIDAKGQTDTSLTGDLKVFVQYLGSLTPPLDSSVPLGLLRIANGQASGTVTLPPVFGPTVLWVEHSSGPAPTYATGTSPRLWYREPTIRDISTPSDEGSLAALATSPLELKQVRVDRSRHGASGRLIVTSVYSQGYSISDVNCADAAGTPPCTTGNYDHVTIFTFSAPRDERGREIKVGQIVPGFTGGVVEFNGLTELSFPQTFAVEGEPELTPARLPAPRELQQSWFGQKIEFERVESSPIAVLGGKVCPVDKDYDTFKQWKLDVGNGCSGDVINLVTSGVVDFDPVANVNRVLPRVVGVLRPINIGSFNVWIIYPRSAQDITLQ